jgi:hypothetical protein
MLFPLRLGTRQECLLHHSYSIKEKELKAIWKGRNKTIPILFDTVVYVFKIPKESFFKTLELIRKLIKVTGYIVNMPNSTIILCTRNEHLEPKHFF